MDEFVTFGMVAFAASITLAAVATVLFVRWHYLPWRTDRREVEEAFDAAQVEDTLRSTLDAVERRVHFRHNIHCPTCGRFSRQATGFDNGVADCGLHGVVVRLTPDTAPIPVIMQAPTRLALVGLNIPEPLPIL